MAGTKRKGEGVVLPPPKRNGSGSGSGSRAVSAISASGSAFGSVRVGGDDPKADVPGEDAAGMGDFEQAPETDSGESVLRPQWNKDEWIQLLFKSTDKSPLGQEVRAFVAGVQQRAKNAAEASENVEAFMDKDTAGFSSHCLQSDKLWDKYAPEFAKIIGCGVEELVKPSGPFLALLCIVWHYPTNTTANPLFGMFFDPSNPCLSLQKAKIGSSGKVLTLDAFPFRMDKPKDGGNPYDGMRFDRWGKFSKLALKYQADFTQNAAIRLVLGKENNLALEKELAGNKSIIVTKAKILVDGKPVKLYRVNAEVFIVQNKSDKAIKQLIFPSYHLETFFYSRPGNGAKFCDMVWNIAAAIIGLEDVNADHFSWKSSQDESEPKWNRLWRNPVDVILTMLHWEQDHGSLAEAMVREVPCLKIWLSKDGNSSALDATHGSLARQIHRVMISKSMATMADPAWKQAQAYQNVVAGRLRGCEKGRATQADPAYKSTDSYQKSTGALAQGHATMADPNWKGTDGHAKQSASRKAFNSFQKRRAQSRWQALMDVKAGKRPAASPEAMKLLQKCDLSNYEKRHYAIKKAGSLLYDDKKSELGGMVTKVQVTQAYLPLTRMRMTTSSFMALVAFCLFLGNGEFWKACE
jgi:hypothetical protein